MADLSSADRNKINLAMRSQPWYQGWFRAQGLNPNSVKLSDGQRQELAAVAAKNGMPIPAHGLIDQAGNVNIQHGFAGLPTWAKVAIESGAALTGAGAFGIGPLAGVMGFGGSSAPVAASGASAVASAAPVSAVGATGGIGPVGSALGFGGPAGFSIGDIVKSAIGPAINATTGVLTARSQARSADRSLQSELDAQRESTAAQSKSAADQLQFLKDQEAARQKEFEKTQALNLDQYNQQLARSAPFRAIGVNALARLGRPISVGSAMGF